VGELHRFVRDHTSRFATDRFGCSQSPALHCPAAAESQRICRCPVNDASGSVVSIEPPTSAHIAELESNRRALLQLQEGAPERINPVRWLETLRLWQAITEATYGGRSSRAKLGPLQHRFEDQLKRWQDAIERRERDPAAASIRNEQQLARAVWTQVRAEGDLASTRRLLAQLAGAPAATSNAAGDPEDAAAAAVPFLTNLVASPHAALWRERELMRQHAAAELQWLQAAAAHRTTSIWFTREAECVAAARRQVFDEAVANTPQIAAVAATFRNQVSQSARRLETLEHAEQALCEASLWLPAMCRWCDQIDWSAIDNSELLDKIGGIPSTSDYCAAALDAFAATSEQLTALAVEATAPHGVSQPSADPGDDAVEQLRQQAQQLATMLDDWIAGLRTTAAFCAEHHPDQRRRQIATLMAVMRCGPLLLEDLTPHELHVSLSRLMELQSGSGSTRAAAADISGAFVMRGESLQRMLRVYGGLADAAAGNPLARLSNETTSDPDRPNHEAASATPLPTPQRARLDALRLRRQLAHAPPEQLWATRHQLRMLSPILDPEPTRPAWLELATLWDRCIQEAKLRTILNDFWAAPRREGQPYFYWAAERVLASQDDRRATVGDRSRRSAALREEERIARHVAAAQRSTWAAGTVEASIDAMHRARVHLLDAAKDSRLPSGLLTIESGPTARAHSAGDRGPAVGSIRHTEGHSAEAPAGPSAAESVAEVAFAGQSLQLSYRGHRFGVTLDASQLAENQVTVRHPADASPPILLLTAGPPRPRELMFVLDCSASMNDPLPAGGVLDSGRDDSTGAHPSRERALPPRNELANNKLSAARATLQRLLSELQSPQLRIGLTLFGHRAARRSDGVGIALQSDYQKAFPFAPTLEPYRDVEVVLPPGRFGEAERSLVDQHLNALRAWGQSPLYLALDRAVTTMERPADAHAKDIVVITDGRNYQFNPTPDAQVALDQIAAAAQRRGVRVHVIGFGIPAAERSPALDDFDRLAKATGGQSIGNISDCQLLLSELKKLTRAPETFSWWTAEGAPTEAKFGQAVQLDAVRSPNALVHLEVAGSKHRVRVSPGDRLEVVWDSRSQNLTTRGLSRHRIAAADLVSATGQTVPASVVIHTPEVLPGARRAGNPIAGQSSAQPLVFSLQRSDRGLPQRPRWTWLEIKPLISGTAPGDAGKSELYRSGEVAWQPGFGWPLGRLECHAWPRAARHAQLMLWCTDQTLPTAAEHRVPAGLASAQPLRMSEGDTIRLSSEWDGRVLQIALAYPTEQNGEKLTDRYCLVRIASGAEANGHGNLSGAVPRPVESTHWYAADASRSLHRFQFEEPGELPQGGAKPLRIRLVRVSALKNAAARLPQPLVFPLDGPPQRLADAGKAPAGR
jgi:hypothetical protein